MITPWTIEKKHLFRQWYVHHLRMKNYPEQVRIELLTAMEKWLLSIPREVKPINFEFHGKPLSEIPIDHLEFGMQVRSLKTGVYGRITGLYPIELSNQCEDNDIGIDWDNGKQSLFWHFWGSNVILTRYPDNDTRGPDPTQWDMDELFVERKEVEFLEQQRSSHSPTASQITNNIQLTFK